VTCSSESDTCSAGGSLLPLVPGDNPDVARNAKCNGTYMYEVRVSKCGSKSSSTTPGWNNQVGFHSTDMATMMGDNFGVDLWNEGGSCNDGGWRCGCTGKLPGGELGPVTGNITLKVSLNTTEWPYFQVQFLAPEGATAPKAGDTDAPYDPHETRMALDKATMAKVRPTFMLGPGAVFTLTPGSNLEDAHDELGGALAGERIVV